MMGWIMVLSFAFSSSIDNFGVGVSYGIRDIRISFFSNILISLITFIFSGLGILFGHWLSLAIPGVLPNIVGTLFVLAIGVRIILLTVPNKRSASTHQQGNKLRSSNVKEILKNPELADIDQSGEIGIGEAFILGVAVSINALTNGLGAGLIGLSPFTISITTAIFSFIALWWGFSMGRRMAAFRIGSFTLGQFSTLLSGIILLLIGLHNLL